MRSTGITTEPQMQAEFLFDAPKAEQRPKKTKPSRKQQPQGAPQPISQVTNAGVQDDAERVVMRLAEHCQKALEETRWKPIEPANISPREARFYVRGMPQSHFWNGIGADLDLPGSPDYRFQSAYEGRASDGIFASEYVAYRVCYEEVQAKLPHMRGRIEILALPQDGIAAVVARWGKEFAAREVSGLVAAADRIDLLCALAGRMDDRTLRWVWPRERVMLASHLAAHAGADGARAAKSRKKVNESPAIEAACEKIGTPELRVFAFCMLLEALSGEGMTALDARKAQQACQQLQARLDAVPADWAPTDEYRYGKRPEVKRPPASPEEPSGLHSNWERARLLEEAKNAKARRAMKAG